MPSSGRLQAMLIFVHSLLSLVANLEQAILKSAESLLDVVSAGVKLSKLC